MTLLPLLLLVLLLVPVLVQLRQAMEVLGCQSWDVGAVLTTDKEVSRLNRQVRRKRPHHPQATRGPTHHEKKWLHFYNA